MRSSRWTFGILVVWSLFCAVGTTRLRITYDIDRFFPQDDPALEHYRRHKSLFADDMRSLLVGVELGKEVNEEGLQRIDLLARALGAIAGVEDVHCLTDLGEPVKLPLGEWIKVPWFTTPYADAQAGLERLARYPELEAHYLSGDKRSSVIVLQLRPVARVQDRNMLLAMIRATCERYGVQYHLAGRLSTQEHYTNATRTQLGLLGGLAVLLMFAVALLTFKHLVTALVPLGISAVALLWTFGPMGWLGIGIEPLLSLLPALLLVLGAAFSIHILSRYRADSGPDRAHAMRAAVRLTDRPNLLSVISSSVGFSTLALYPILPLRTFGWATAFGLVAAFVAARTIIPWLTPWLPTKGPGGSRWSTLRTTGLLRHRSLVVGCAALLLLLGSSAFPFLEVRNHFLDDLDRSSRLGRDATFFEEHFSGTRPLEITVQAADTSKDLLDPLVLHATGALMDSIGRRFGVVRPMGPPDLARAAMRAIHLGDALPTNPDDAQAARRTVKQWLRSGAPTTLLTGDLRTGRIAGRTPDVGSDAFRAHMASLAPLLNNAHIRTTITGGAWLLDEVNRNIALILVQGILTAILLDALLIAVVLRSWRSGVVSIWPNMVAMAFTATLLWVLDAPLKVGTAMIFPILYGVALDETVHFLMHVRHHRHNGHARSAIVRTLRELSGALFNTTLITSAGFCLLGLSDFASIELFGFVTGLALWVALAAVLWVLPVLLRTDRPGK